MRRKGGHLQGQIQQVGNRESRWLNSRDTVVGSVALQCRVRDKSSYSRQGCLDAMVVFVH